MPKRSRQQDVNCRELSPDQPDYGVRVFVDVTGNGGLKGKQLRFFSYNILSDTYASARRAAGSLNWKSRWRCLQQELSSYNADVYFLQEVERRLFESDIWPLFQNKGYGAVYSDRNDNMVVSYGESELPADCVSNAANSLKQPTDFQLAARDGSSRVTNGDDKPGDVAHTLDNIEGLTIIYTKDKLACIDYTATSFAACSCEGVDPFWDLVQKKGGGLLMAALVHKQSNLPVVVANTHLWFEPQLPHLKLAQAHLLCHHVRAFQSKLQGDDPSAPHTVVAGDFNSLWQKHNSDAFDQVQAGRPLTSGVYELMSMGRVTAQHPHHPVRRRRPLPGQQLLRNFHFTSAGLDLCSAHMLAHGREPALTFRSASFAGCIDYIWLEKERFRVTETLMMPYYEPPDLKNPSRVHFPPIPNDCWPSDHLAVGCTVELL